jgi:hypothetical protein
VKAQMTHGQINKVPLIIASKVKKHSRCVRNREQEIANKCLVKLLNTIVDFRLISEIYSTQGDKT